MPWDEHRGQYFDTGAPVIHHCYGITNLEPYVTPEVKGLLAAIATF